MAHSPSKRPARVSLPQKLTRAMRGHHTRVAKSEAKQDWFHRKIYAAYAGATAALLSGHPKIGLAISPIALGVLFHEAWHKHLNRQQLTHTKRVLGKLLYNNSEHDPAISRFLLDHPFIGVFPDGKIKGYPNEQAALLKTRLVLDSYRVFAGLYAGEWKRRTRKKKK